jgi:hypothetical protein
LSWNGAAWRQAAAPSGVIDLNAVTATSTRNAWAAGDSSAGPVILRWTGTTWRRAATLARSSTAESLEGLAATAATNAWAVGHGCPRRSDCDVPEPVIMHWNGHTWKLVACPNPPNGARNDLIGVAAISNRAAWAVGATDVRSAASGTFAVHWNGTAWKQTPVPNPPGGTDLFGVAATSERNAWAVGYTTSAIPRTAIILHWNGSIWRRTR